MKKQRTGTKKSVIRHPRPLMLASIIVAVLALAGVGYWLKTHHEQPANSTTKPSDAVRPVGSVDYGPPGQHDNDAVNNYKDNPSSSPSTLDGFSNGSTGTPSVTVSRVNADDSAKTVTVGTMVDGVTSGSCTLTFTKNGQTAVARTASVTTDNNSSSCGVITVPYSDFGASGDWNVSVTVTTNGKTGTGTWPAAITINK